jgi:hypothetical protein
VPVDTALRDLTQSDQMELTQEFLAQMLGVRCASVSLVAGTLQKDWHDPLPARRGGAKRRVRMLRKGALTL